MPTVEGKEVTSADAFRLELMKWFECVRAEAQARGLTLIEQYGVNAGTVMSLLKALKSRYVRTRIDEQTFLPLHTSRSDKWEFTPDVILLAAGMGKETTLFQDSANVDAGAFWGIDHSTAPQSADQIWVIGGGGDGALQDFLRLVAKQPDPLKLVSGIAESLDSEDRTLWEASVRALSTFENEYRLALIWSAGGATDPTPSIDRLVLHEARNLATRTGIVKAVQAALRVGRGEVHLVWKDSHFSKSYLLNRFLVHLFRACVDAATDRAGNPSHRLGQSMRMYFHPSTLFPNVVKDATTGKFQVSFAGGVPPPFEADHAVLRFGPQSRGTLFAQLIGLEGEQYATRTTLANIYLPFAP